MRGGLEGWAPAAVLFFLFPKVYLMPSKFLGFGGGFFGLFFCFFFCQSRKPGPSFLSMGVGDQCCPPKRPMFKFSDVATLTRAHCPGFCSGRGALVSVQWVVLGEGVALVVPNGVGQGTVWLWSHWDSGN